MSNKHGENYLPFFKRGKELNVKSQEEVKRSILNAPEVKAIIATMI